MLSIVYMTKKATQPKNFGRVAEMCSFLIGLHPLQQILIKSIKWDAGFDFFGRRRMSIRQDRKIGRCAHFIDFNSSQLLLRSSSWDERRQGRFRGISYP